MASVIKGKVSSLQAKLMTQLVSQSTFYLDGEDEAAGHLDFGGPLIKQD